MRNRIMAYGFLFILCMYLLPGPTGAADPAPQRPSAEDYREAVSVQSRHESEIFRVPGVRGVGIGTDAQGLSLSVLYHRDGPPPTLASRFENLTVRLYPVGEFRALTAPVPRDGGAAHQTFQPLPTPMGVSGGHALICNNFCTGGTLGFKVCDASSGQVGYITNNHVAASGCPNFCPNSAPIGTAQRQPGSIDNGCLAAQNIGSLSRFVTISDGGLNQVDAAFVASSDAQVSSTILDIGIPTTSPVDPPLNGSVMKSGR
ncbi:MAG: hypothetical protein HY650_04475, partial [Acidobacteria bacterium]|nr:hypothetical protein [Acidobacteriota bacterium]